MRRSGIFWGIVLVVLGVLFLLQSMGVLPPQINAWAIFWPLLLIALGIGALLRSTRPGSVKEESLRLPLDQTREARVKVYYGAGELRIDDRAAPGELLNGSFMGGVDQRTYQQGDISTVELRVPVQNFPMGWQFDRAGGLNWTVGLNPDIPLHLELEVGASRNLIDLHNLQVKELRLSTGASASEIQFPERAGMTAAWLKAGAAAVNVVVPAGVAARIHTRAGLAGIEVDGARFPHNGDEYRSADYDTAENRLDLEIEAGVGTVRVR